MFHKTAGCALLQKGEVLKALFVERPNRFLAKIIIDGKTVEAFVPNPGRMHEFMFPGREVYIRFNPAPHRRTSFDMIGLRHNGVLVSIDSNLPNRFMKRLLVHHDFPYLQGYDSVISEPRVYEGRFDFHLLGKKSTFVEVKSCTLVEDGHALFPDAPTSRGVRHMRHLAQALKDGIVQQAAVVFVIQRPDARVFSPHDRNDPKFGQALRFAYSEGVDVIPITTKVVNWDLELTGKISFEPGPLDTYPI